MSSHSRVKKRIILAARHYSIEPLGILYLAGLARECNWECKVVLVHGNDFEPLYEEVRGFLPDLVGFQIWTGGHLPMFAACDRVRALGVPVVIGGPHATYFGDTCREHADWVVKGGSFGLLKNILMGELSNGLHFDASGREQQFPMPDRDIVYRAYPELAASPIKSMFGEIGCPFECTYCYAPAFNTMHGGFRLTVRPVGELIAEAQAILKSWPCHLIYFQDDIFGYNMKWLEEFAARWQQEVGVPFHCQIRLELTRHAAGDKRLDLFVKAGCSGITLAIESGNAFLRDHVLFRHMPDELIIEGCRKVLDRGMTLRTEQILAVPFSSRETDLSTLELNNKINPTMAWTSILAPYQGTDMGTIVENFGFYHGNNDDLSDTFFDRSILHHVEGGPGSIKEAVAKVGAGPKDRALLHMRAERNGDPGRAHIVHDEKGVVGELTFLDQAANANYCDDTVRIQRLFNVLARMPEARRLGELLLTIPETAWSWSEIGEVTTKHLAGIVGEEKLRRWKHQLAEEMACNPEALPPRIAEHPFYFCYLPSGGEFAHNLATDGTFAGNDIDQTLDRVNTRTRRHLFGKDLYKVESAVGPIAYR